MRRQIEMAVWDYNERKPSVLRELFDLIAGSFRTPAPPKNDWAMPFNTSPPSVRRCFGGRKPEG